MSAQDPEARTESIPEPSQILRDMVVRKKSSDGIFVARRVVVSRTTLFFAPEGEDLILDDIHLYEIESIEVIEVERKMKKVKGGVARVPSFGRTSSFSLSQHGRKSLRDLFQDRHSTSSRDSSPARLPSLTGSRDGSPTRVNELQEDGVFRSGATESGHGRLDHCLIKTTQEGRHVGHVYEIKCQSEEECNDFVHFLTAQIKDAVKEQFQVKGWERFQRKLKGFYDSNFCQAAVACLIMISFLCNVVKLEVDPGGANPDLQKTFTALELLFTIVFCMELAVNMTAKWFWLFWEDNWNRFDFFVVITSLVATVADTVVDTESDGASDSKAVYAVRAVRLLRAFRVMRLFRQIESIHKIVNALGLSLVPLGNAFFIVFLILSVYGTRVQM